MNLVEFSKRVNLERYLEVQGQKDIIAKQHDYFGWLGYHVGTGECLGHIVDIFGPVVARNLYENITQKHPECLDIKTLYNQKTDWNFKTKVDKHFFWSTVYLLSLDQIDKHILFVTQNKVRTRTHLKDYLLENGYLGYIENKFGMLTDDIMREYPTAEWPETFRYKKTLLLPSWYAPGKICTVEVCRLDNAGELTTVYQTDKDIPKGWYGLLGQKFVESIPYLSCQPGFVWSELANPFIKTPIKFDQSVSAATCIRVWSKSTTLEYVEHPAETLEDRGFHEYFFDNLHKLRKGEVENLETNLKMSLLPTWLETRKEHTEIDDKKFSKRPEGYFICTATEEKAITDFTVDILKFIVKKKQVYAELEVCRDKTFYTIIVNNKLLQKSSFIYKLRNEFMRHGIGFVKIEPAYEKLVVELIIRFSENAPIIHQDVKKATAGIQAEIKDLESDKDEKESED